MTSRVTATILPTATLHARLPWPLHDVCPQDRSAQITLAACGQTPCRNRGRSTNRRLATRRDSRHTADATDRPERPCPNRRPRQPASPQGAGTSPSAGSPTPACPRGETASAASRPDQTNRDPAARADPRGCCARPPLDSEGRAAEGSRGRCRSRQRGRPVLHFSASHAAIDPRPPPTSRHRQPGWTRPRRRRETGS